MFSKPGLVQGRVFFCMDFKQMLALFVSLRESRNLLFYFIIIVNPGDRMR